MTLVTIRFVWYVSLLPRTDCEIRDETGMRSAFSPRSATDNYIARRIVVLAVLITLRYSVNGFAGMILDAVRSADVE